MALQKLPYNVDNLDKAKEIVKSNMHLLDNDKGFPERWRSLSDHHWGEKITLANKIIDRLNSSNDPQQ